MIEAVRCHSVGGDDGGGSKVVRKDVMVMAVAVAVAVAVAATAIMMVVII